MAQGIVYGLVDRRTGELRYIGKTVRSADERLRGHLGNARHGDRSHKSNWIRKIGAKNVQAIGLPMPFGVTELEEAEKMWIAHFREKGCRLTNMTDGGEGFAGFTKSPEQRRKIAEAQIGRAKSAETRARMSRAQLERHAAMPAGAQSAAIRKGWEKRR